MHGDISQCINSDHVTIKNNAIDWFMIWSFSPVSSSLSIVWMVLEWTVEKYTLTAKTQTSGIVWKWIATFSRLYLWIIIVLRLLKLFSLQFPSVTLNIFSLYKIKPKSLGFTCPITKLAEFYFSYSMALKDSSSSSSCISFICWLKSLFVFMFYE